MVSKKKIFLCPSPLSMSSNKNLMHKEAILNFYNSKKSTKSSTKHCNFKKFCILLNIL